MPDITMCKNTKCKFKEKCVRNEASGTKPNPNWQSYSSFETPEHTYDCPWWVSIEGIDGEN